MNEIVVGSNKEALLESIDTSSPFLLLDDGELIDALGLPGRVHRGKSSIGVVHFDVAEHHFNPLKGIDYVRAREFVAVLDAVFPEGDSTLTKENARFEILIALLKKPTVLSKLISQPFDNKDTGKVKAYQMMQTLMLSPVLRSVLCEPINFSLDGIVLARLDRAKITDNEALVIGLLLISMFKHQVIVSDFGAYGRDHHTYLVRQKRLTAGITTLSELSEKLRHVVLTIPAKRAAGATVEDALTLATYRGLVPRTVEHNAYVEEATE